MSTVILYLWIASAASNYNSHATWAPSGEYAGMAACEAAIVRLAMAKSARCVDTGRAVLAAKGGAQ